MPAAKRYTAFCTVCYSQRLDNVGLRAAEKWCTSHSAAYGHQCTLVPYTKNGPGYNVAAERNPPLVAFTNPRRKVVAQLSKRAYALQYKHVEDGKAYSHTFKRGVCIELLADGSIRLYRMDRKPLFGDF